MLVTNILYVSNNYIVKLAQLSAGETALVRGFIQFVVFGTLIIIKKRKFVSNATETESKDSKYKTKNTYTTLVFCTVKRFSCIKGFQEYFFTNQK